MARRNSGLLLGAALLAMGLGPGIASAQQTTTAVAGAEYELNGPLRLILGGNWRDVWTTPVRVPVLDLSAHGGLTPTETGGRQSRTLHFEGGDGRDYIFRSINKYLHREALPPDVRHTPIGNLMQDQISTMFPAPGVPIAPIQEAVGLLHSWPTLVVLPDDARLGEFREVYAGMMGQFEENPNEGKDDTPGFAGSTKIHNSENFYERMDKSPEYRLNSHEFLKARLIDFLIGDTDRGGDQWKFARFPRGDGYIYRPIPRDRDFAFLGGDGAFNMVSRAAYPKLIHFGESFESITRLTIMTRDMDRRLLADIPRTQFDSIVRFVQTRVTDAVLRDAISRMPPEYQALASGRLLSALTARRDRLHEPAAELYAMVAREADVHATAEAERAEIERYADGSVDVRIFGGAAAAVAASGALPAPGSARGATPYFHRRFMPSETREVRLYMHDGDDRVQLYGNSPGGILVRVIGGGGDDILEDVSRLQDGGTATVFYTAGGDDRVTPGASTRVDARDYDHGLPGRPEDMKREVLADSIAEEVGDPDVAAAKAENELIAQKLGGSSSRDWGFRRSFGPAFDHRGGVGILVGAKHDVTRYGFRRDPYRTRVQTAVLFAPETRRFGVEFEADRRLENSPLGLSVAAHATQFGSFRFFGWGNDTPLFDGNTRVRRDEIAVRPAVSWYRPQWQLSLGPVLRYGRLHYDDNAPIDVVQPFAADEFGQAGAWAEMTLRRGSLQPASPRGTILDAGVSAYPALLDVTSTYGEAHAVARSYIGVPGLGSSFLALRAGAQKVFGEFAVHDAAFLGGRHTLRGHTTDRFAGDAMLYGSTELHVPVTELTLLVRGRLGAFGLADAGRVYFDGDSPGGWHTAFGGGLTFTSLAHVVSVTYARGEAGRLYLELGLPF